MKTDEQLKAENQAIREMLASGPEARLMAIPGVIHVSVGLKEKDGLLTDQLCIRVYVRAKRALAEVAADEIVPREINGIPTDVNVVGEFQFQADNTRYRPIKGGIRLTNGIIDINIDGTGTQQSRGTLGCLAIDNTDNAPVLLSNWHVLYANHGTAGDKVFQPPPTTLPSLTLLQLPFRSPDETDKIGVIRRSAITTNVDGAIATVDVSSCCHCCGIHFTNEINGLSVGGRPPRNTIVGHERAISGMAVFKVGAATLRQEGVVVDDNYPEFSLTDGGTTHSFTGQIAIHNIDNTIAFGAHGDSGAVVINMANKIVGLLFAAAREGQPPPLVSLANHISNVFTALNIRIPYSPDVVVTAGELLADAAPVLEAPIPEPYRALRERLQRHENTARLFALGERHAREITYLVNHCKPVTIAWHRCKGPALLATVMAAVRDGHDRLPRTVKGVAPHEALETMRAVLSRYGSPALQEHLGRPETAPVIAELKDCTDVNEVIERIRANQTLGSLLRGIAS